LKGYQWESKRQIAQENTKRQKKDKNSRKVMRNPKANEPKKIQILKACLNQN
jgi:hypothetical protein